MDWNLTGNIIAIILSPIIASIVAIWVGELIRRRNYQKQREDDLLQKLVAFRFTTHSPEFLSAINSVNFVFYKSIKIKELIKNLHHAFSNDENPVVINQKIVELIYEICKYRKYNVTEYEIQNIFQIKPHVQIVKQPIIKQEAPSQTPSSTSTSSNIITNNQRVTSQSETSITAGYLSVKNKS